MALIYQAQLTPTKSELLARWVPSQPWADASGTGELTPVAAYRFDDPDGEVGMETHLVQRDGGPVHQVPLTYRPEPLAGAEHALVTTMEHSVLGRRWVYDGCADRVYLTALIHAIVQAGTEAEELVQHDGYQEPRRPSAAVVGSGPMSDEPFAVPAVHEDGPVRQETAAGVTTAWQNRVPVQVRRVLTDAVDPAGAPSLVGSWRGGEPTVLAVLPRG